MKQRGAIAVVLLLALVHLTSAAGKPVVSLKFMPKVSSHRFPATNFSREYVVTQHLIDEARYGTGALVVTFSADADWRSVVWSLFLGHIVGEETRWFDVRENILVELLDREPPQLLVLPFEGWERGGQYVIRFDRKARFRDGRPLVDEDARWYIEIPKVPNRIQATAKTARSFNHFTGGRPWALTYDNYGQPVLVAAEGVNRHAQFAYGAYGRITSRNGLRFAYDTSGRRVEDDRYKYIWDWRSRLYGVTVKDEWLDEDGGVFAPTYAGHTVHYEYDALGRLLWRKHYGADGGLIERRDFIWEHQCLLAEIAFTDDTRTSLRWRKIYLPGPTGLDDQVQVHVQSFPTSDTEEPINKVYTFLRDELGTVIGLVEEYPGADPTQPPPAVVKYLYTPYGEVTAMAGPATLHPEEFFPGGQNLLFQGLWTDMVTGMAYARARWYDPRNTHFLSEDPARNVDSENLYMFAAGRPHVFADPMGMTSRSDIKNNRLIYTWHLEWIDFSHAQTTYPSLEDAWQQLQDATVGETVSFQLSMKQGDEGAVTFKQTDISFDVIAAETTTGRKNQLLFAWQHLSEEFESFQGQGIQSSQIATALWGTWKGEEQKVASSYSTEDLVSDLLMFYTVVEGETREQLLTSHAGRLDEEDEENFSYLVWDFYLRPQPEGNRDWEPLYADHERMLDPNLISNAMGDWGDIRRIISLGPELAKKYLERFGKPAMPEFFQQYTPDATGVTAHDTENRGGAVENLLEKLD